MPPYSSNFYVTGGTLSADAPSYVERRADADLHDGLSRGEFCYILTARQMGKSSLMARTARRLAQEGAAVAILDLTAVGQNLSAEQWYDGLLSHLGQSLGLEEDLEEFWLDHGRLGPLQRWMAALRQVVLARVPGRIVIFIDEIDAVRSLPFSTDEFFAAIRECYNRRNHDPEFARLAFCLLGVASPSDLIRDTRTTPFNIGRRIELTDFSEAEAAPLALGLLGSFATEDTEGTEKETQTVLERVLHWTGGHPYLTQRLCRSIAEAQAAMRSSKPSSSSSVSSVNSVAKSPSQFVDRLCDELFLSPRAREQDDNLLFVREQLLRSEVDRAGLLELYGQVRRGKPVRDDAANPLVTVLRLSGVARVTEGVLQVRNRIYARVFDFGWIATNMPDAELRRQRAAYRRGLARAAAVSAVIVAAMAGLVVTAVSQARRAEQATRREAGERQRAQEGQQALRRHLYATQTNLAAQALEANNVPRALDLLTSQRPKPGEEDLRGFEWRLLWNLAHRSDALAIIHASGAGSALAFSPNGRWLASGGDTGTVRLYDAATRRVASLLRGHTNWVGSLAFSSDGRLLATASGDKTVRLWELQQRPGPQGVTVRGRELAVLQSPRWAGNVIFSRDDRFLVANGGDSEVRVWQRASRRLMKVFKIPGGINSLALSPDARILATCGGGGARLWDLSTRRQVAVLAAPRVESVAFSPDGRMLATGGSTVRLWDAATRRILATLIERSRSTAALAFSADGRFLATGSSDRTVRIWNLKTRDELAVLRGHRGSVEKVAFSPDGKTVASVGDRTIRLWSVTSDNREYLKGRHGGLNGMAVSGDGKVLATGGDNGVKLWDLTNGQPITPFPGYTAHATFVAISPDGRTVAAGCEDRSVTVWDVPTRRRLVRLPLKNRPVFPPVALSPDGHTLAFGDEHTIRLWDRATGREVALPRVLREGEFGGLNGLAFSPDGSLLASTTGGNPTMKLWDVKGRRRLHTFTGYTYFSSCPAFSPDGRLLATYDGPDRGLRVWDVASKQLVRAFKLFSRQISSIGFSADGKTLITSSQDGTIKLWNVSSWQEAATLEDHLLSDWAMAIAPDALITGKGDIQVRLWRAPPLPQADAEADAEEENPIRLVTTVAGGTVTLTWQPVPDAVGYHVYRGAAGAKPQALVKGVPQRVSGTTFTNTASNGAGGRGGSYAVAALFGRRGQREAEGPRAAVQVHPVVAPPGWIGASIDERGGTGSVAWSPRDGVFTLRGAGADVWGTSDNCYFAGHPLERDGELTVRILARPEPAVRDGTAADPFARAGVMLREGLAPDARMVALLVFAESGLASRWRLARGRAPQWDTVLPDAALRLAPPATLHLRLRRQGSEVRAAYSTDGGRSFRPAGKPIRFDPPLQPSLHAGLAITAHDPAQISEAKFSDLRLETAAGR